MSSNIYQVDGKFLSYNFYNGKTSTIWMHFFSKIVYLRIAIYFWVKKKQFFFKIKKSIDSQINPESQNWYLKMSYHTMFIFEICMMSFFLLRNFEKSLQYILHIWIIWILCNGLFSFIGWYASFFEHETFFHFELQFRRKQNFMRHAIQVF